MPRIAPQRLRECVESSQNLHIWRKNYTMPTAYLSRAPADLHKSGINPDNRAATTPCGFCQTENLWAPRNPHLTMRPNVCDNDGVPRGRRKAGRPPASVNESTNAPGESTMANSRASQPWLTKARGKTSLTRSAMANRKSTMGDSRPVEKMRRGGNACLLARNRVYSFPTRGQKAPPDSKEQT